MSVLTYVLFGQMNAVGRPISLQSTSPPACWPQQTRVRCRLDTVGPSASPGLVFTLMFALNFMTDTVTQDMVHYLYSVQMTYCTRVVANAHLSANWNIRNYFIVYYRKDVLCKLCFS